MNFIFIFLLSLLSARAQVQEWGNPLQQVENFLGMGLMCNEADRPELDYIDCEVETYEVINRDARTDFDNLTEQLIFMEAARRTHQLSICQGKLHDRYARDVSLRSTMQDNAIRQFQQVAGMIAPLLQRQEEARSTVANYRDNYSYAEDRNNPRYTQWRNERLQTAQTSLNLVTDQINALVARIPMGNRPPMRDMLVDLLKTNPTIAAPQFRARYETVMTELRRQTAGSNRFFSNISRPHPNGTGTYYNINNELKLNLVQTGQVENVVVALGMQDRLARGFVCRTRSRYERGPQARQALEIPLYFAGGYGLGRLAVRAGVSAIRATTVAGRIAAEGARVLAYAAMIGVEGIQIAPAVMQSCAPQEFIAASLNEQCTEDTEVNGVYMESSIAQCVTSSVLNLAPVAFVGGVTLARLGRTEVRVPAGRVDTETPDRPIVVEAPVVRPPSRFSQAAQSKVDETRRRIMETQVPRNRTSETEMFDRMNDPAMERGFRAALGVIHNREAVAEYMTKLQEDTFARMLDSGNPDLIRRANAGELDGPSMEAVLRQRVADRGQRIVEIPGQGEISSEEFRRYVSQGYIIDRANPTPNHGVYGHLLQQDLTYDVIARESGKSQQEIMQYLGSERGHQAWVGTFDGFDEGVPTQVESFRSLYMRDIPLP